jgi:hypothetical protein
MRVTREETGDAAFIITSRALAGKMDRQRGGKRQMHFKMTQPLKTIRRLMLRTRRIIAYRTPVIGDKPELGFLRVIIGDDLVTGIGKGCRVDPGEMGNIQKAFYLPSGKTVHFKGRAVDLLKTSVIPVGHGWQRLGFSASNARHVQIRP